VLIAASTGSMAFGALSMLSFAVVSSIGLIGATLAFERLARRPGPTKSRLLALVLALGSILFVIRPVHALRHGDTASCHAPAQDHAAYHRSDTP
jgi:sulfite exporter TauE/SafE